jgi:hypothetical protein
VAETTLTRRGLLSSGAAAAGALAIPAVANAKPKEQSIFKLVPNGGTCKACLSHATASLFPTAKAAAGNRAHVGCNCTVVRGSIDYGTFVALFGDPRDVRSYRADLRSKRNQAILKNHAPVFRA